MEATPPLSQKQEEMAEFLLEQCGLGPYADTPFEMMGASGTVRYGLGRCANHLMGMTPDDIRALVLTKLEQQGNYP